MKTVFEFLHILLIIVIYEVVKAIARTEKFQDVLSWGFFACAFLSFVPILIGLGILAVTFAIFGQNIAVGIVIGLGLIGIVFRVTNGFGQKFS
jgi:hypothetical protein